MNTSFLTLFLHNQIMFLNYCFAYLLYRSILLSGIEQYNPQKGRGFCPHRRESLSHCFLLSVWFRLKLALMSPQSWLHSPVLLLNLFCNWGSVCGKSYAPVAGDHRFPVFLLQDSIYLTNNHSLWLPFLCGSDPLTSGDPGKVLLVSPLSSLGMPSLLASSSI